MLRRLTRVQLTVSRHFDKTVLSENNNSQLRSHHLLKRWRSGQVQDENLSYIHHPGRVPLIDTTIGSLLQTAVERWPDRECVVSMHQNIRLTFSELLKRADKLAAGLKKLGLKKGDRMGIWGPNDVEWLIAFMAGTRLGLVISGINPFYQQKELEYCISKVDTKLVVSPESFRKHNYAKMLIEAKKACPCLETIVLYTKEPVEGTRRMIDIEELASKKEVDEIRKEQNAISPASGCNIQFTSGTTGLPKATYLSHKSFVNNSRQGMSRSEFDIQHHKICMNVPFFHAFGMVMAVVGCLHAGSTIVLEGQSFNPVNSLEAVTKEKCTAMFGTPTMWTNLIDVQHRLGYKVETLLAGTTGGAPASPDLFKRIRHYFRFENIRTIYGLTELTALTFQSLPGEDKHLTDSTVGHVSDHLEVKVVDEKGSLVPFGTQGELWVRGYSTMLEYWGDPKNTKNTISEDGWLKTGDQFVLRKDGYGHIVGRLKDMLIRGGENIFPKEIESFLETHPKILEAHVFGVHDAVYGEEICACIRLHEGSHLTKEELIHFSKDKISHFKIPRYIEICDQFPKTTSGKVQKFILKRNLEERGVIPKALQNQYKV